MIATHRALQVPINAAAAIAGVLIVVMMLHVSADVLARTVLGAPIGGTTEIVAGYYMVAVVFLPLAYVAHNEGHISVELFTRSLPRTPQLVLEVIIGMFGIGYMAMFTWQSIQEALRRQRMDEFWETAEGFLTIWPSRWMLPLGGALLTIYMIARIADDLRALARRA